MDTTTRDTAPVPPGLPATKEDWLPLVYEELRRMALRGIAARLVKPPASR